MGVANIPNNPGHIITEVGRSVGQEHQEQQVRLHLPSRQWSLAQHQIMEDIQGKFPTNKHYKAVANKLNYYTNIIETTKHGYTRDISNSQYY